MVEWVYILRWALERELWSKTAKLEQTDQTNEEYVKLVELYFDEIFNLSKLHNLKSEKVGFQKFVRGMFTNETKIKKMK